MPAKSYGFAIGNLRANENSLLKQSDLLQLLAAKDTDELAAMLRDKGFGDSAVITDIPGMLKAETAKLWKYLLELAPDADTFEPFIYENDFHNLKVVLKATVRGLEYHNLLLIPASIDISKIEAAVKEKKFDILPDFMRKSAERAYEILTHSGDSQLSDGILDAACMTAQLAAARETKNNVIIDIITANVFYNNIKVALRAAMVNKNAAFLDDTLTDTGVVSKQNLKAAALAGEDRVVELLSSVTVMNGNAAAECYKKSSGDFEKFTENFILKSAKRCKYATMGVEPIIGYILARKAEIKDVQIIYSGIKTGQPQEKTKERLRELYD